MKKLVLIMAIMFLFSCVQTNTFHIRSKEVIAKNVTDSLFSLYINRDDIDMTTQLKWVKIYMMDEIKYLPTSEQIWVREKHQDALKELVKDIERKMEGVNKKLREMEKKR